MLPHFERKRGADEMETEAIGTDPWYSSFTWRIEDFSDVSAPLLSDSFEAGIGPWRLRDTMWAPASVKFKLPLVNQADASKSRSAGFTSKFNADAPTSGEPKLIELSTLRGEESGFLLNRTLVLTMDVTVEHKDRFKLDTGGAPCDVVMKLPCGAELPVSSHILQMTSPFFSGAPQDVNGSAPIPVDGNLSTWYHILSDLYPQYDSPDLTWGSVYVLLPLTHKYDFTKLTKRMVAFAKEKSSELSPNAGNTQRYVIWWIALAERLQLDELFEVCLSRLRTMTRQELHLAIAEAAPAGGRKQRVVRAEVKQLGKELREEVLTIAALAS
ncbi:hypothetical protein FOA52_006482 [Chlamydomonas sp. UWO 241]|nr:hypothetical protein FOA52_006482 [Chlamydomonas sp. UWO 241]